MASGVGAARGPRPATAVSRATGFGSSGAASTAYARTLVGTRIEILHPSDPEIANAVVELQRAAYAVEAEIIGFDGIPQLHESAAELAHGEERWLGLWEDCRLVAALSYLVEGELLDICRVVVSPGDFRRGFATALIEEVRGRVAHAFAIVSTGANNAPAVRLYRKLGFSPVNRHNVAPGVDVISLAAPRRPQPL